MQEKNNNNSSRQKIVRIVMVLVVLCGLASIFLYAVKGMMPKKNYPEVSDYEPWAPEVVEAARGVPIQNGGRVKPLETFASYLMLSMRGDRTMKVIGKDGKKVKIKPMEWMLDTLFRPQLALELPTFRVDNSEVLEAIGMDVKEMRDRYSYTDLEPHLGEMMRLGSEYENQQREWEQQGSDETLELDQKQLLELARNFRTYEALVSYFAFARAGVELKGAGADGSSQFQRLSTVMETAPLIQKVIADARASGETPPPNVMTLLRQVTDLSNAAKYGLTIIPPHDKTDVEWRTAGNQIWDVIVGEHAEPAKAIKDIAAMEAVAISQAQGTDAFITQLKEWNSGLSERARSRGEYGALKTELSYNNGNWFFNSLFFCFVPASLFLVLGWLAPKSLFGTITTGLVWVFSGLGLLFIVVATIQRMIIMDRPPVGNLYDTIPFITAGIVLVAMITEVLTRRRLAIALAPIAGFLGLVLARAYEFGDASDPNDPLLAVLRSNFWLTTHVLTITFGYAAGLLTAGLGLAYLALRISGLDNGDKKLRRLITRMTYGGVCFTLFLSLVGTVLGGIWANYSWGRFWGWDPKENGALLIVIWMLFILHARMGGFLREWGVNISALFSAVIVTFSWWHVNLLGVGLHSYGFSESKKQAVFIFYGIMFGVVLIAMGFAIYDNLKKSMPKKQGGEGGAPPLRDATPAK